MLRTIIASNCLRTRTDLPKAKMGLSSYRPSIGGESNNVQQNAYTDSHEESSCQPSEADLMNSYIAGCCYSTSGGCGGGHRHSSKTPQKHGMFLCGYRR